MAREDGEISRDREWGMSVVGCESMLAILCAYETLVAEKLARGEEPTASMINAVKTLAGQFYETPSTQFSKQAGGQPSETEDFWDRFRVLDGGKGAA
jgi:hypothetical protein